MEEVGSPGGKEAEEGGSGGSREEKCFRIGHRRRGLGGMWGSPLDRAPAFKAGQAPTGTARGREGLVKVEPIGDFVDDPS